MHLRVFFSQRKLLLFIKLPTKDLKCRGFSVEFKFGFKPLASTLSKLSQANKLWNFNTTLHINRHTKLSKLDLKGTIRDINQRNLHQKQK